jgi:hypothetical protein
MSEGSTLILAGLKVLAVACFTNNSLKFIGISLSQTYLIAVGSIEIDSQRC